MMEFLFNRETQFFKCQGVKMTHSAVLVINVEIVNVYKQYDEALWKHNNSMVQFYFLYRSTDLKYLKKQK